MNIRLIVPGDRFGRLEFLREIESTRRPNGRLIRRGIFRCDCGVEKPISFVCVWSKETESCGCLIVEAVRAANTRHGLTNTPTHKSWESMLRRCENPNDKDYPRYGGRGIQVCERWSRFESFLEDMGQCPAGLTIERRNNNRHYCPSNCYWGTRKTQARNRSNNRVLTVRGVTGCISELCEHFQADYYRTMSRLHLGWPIERALFEPLQAQFSHSERFGQA